MKPELSGWKAGVLTSQDQYVRNFICKDQSVNSKPNGLKQTWKHILARNCAAIVAKNVLNANIIQAFRLSNLAHYVSITLYCIACLLHEMGVLLTLVFVIQRPWSNRPPRSERRTSGSSWTAFMSPRRPLWWSKMLNKCSPCPLMTNKFTNFSS